MAMTTDFSSTFDERSAIKLIGSDMTKAAADKVYEQSGLRPRGRRRHRAARLLQRQRARHLRGARPVRRGQGRHAHRRGRSHLRRAVGGEPVGRSHLEGPSPRCHRPGAVQRAQLAAARARRTAVRCRCEAGAAAQPGARRRCGGGDVQGASRVSAGVAAGPPASPRLRRPGQSRAGAGRRSRAASPSRSGSPVTTNTAWAVPLSLVAHAAWMLQSLSANHWHAAHNSPIWSGAVTVIIRSPSASPLRRTTGCPRGSNDMTGRSPPADGGAQCGADPVEALCALGRGPKW